MYVGTLRIIVMTWDGINVPVVIDMILYMVMRSSLVSILDASLVMLSLVKRVFVMHEIEKIRLWVRI